MCILPKWRDKGYGKYLMDKAFSSDPEIENVKQYAVTRLIHGYIPSGYEEPVIQYIDYQLTTQISYNAIADDANARPRIPQFRK